jgi:hypothetical protein
MGPQRTEMDIRHPLAFSKVTGFWSRMRALKPWLGQLRLNRYRVAYALTVILFFWLVAAFYIPGKGFTAFISFGERASAGYLPALKELDIYIEPDSDGYDAQHYAQMAIQPDVRDPALASAVDNIAYRARRILFSATAWLFGFGSPALTIQIFALQNVACWLGLALLLLRWFPANSWNNYIRWTGVLLSCGLWLSIRGALVDGPSLLLIAASVALSEAGRVWWATLLLGLSGLAKETNILAAGAVVQTPNETWRSWKVSCVRAVVVLLPLTVWTTMLLQWFGKAGGAGLRNFDFIGAGYLEKCGALLVSFRGEDILIWNNASLLWIVSVTVQFLFIVLRPRWRELWWRIGAAYCVLMLFLGDAVWEGHPGAAPRVLLPLALAFNVLVPRTRFYFGVLLLGNMTVLSVFQLTQPPAYISSTVRGPEALRAVENTSERFEVMFLSGWHTPEKSRSAYWRWSKGNATTAFQNPHPYVVTADIKFEMISLLKDRTVTVRCGDHVIWKGLVSTEHLTVSLKNVRFLPGETLWQFETDLEGVVPDPRDPRLVAFKVRNLQVDLTSAVNE